jgi:hypothetical protein
MGLGEYRRHGRYISLLDSTSWPWQVFHFCVDVYFLPLKASLVLSHVISSGRFISLLAVSISSHVFAHHRSCNLVFGWAEMNVGIP